MEKLDRLVWAGSSTYHLGPLHIGIRSDSVWLDEIIREALSAYHIPGVDAPANYSVVVPHDDSRGNAQGLNMLYEGHTNLVRTRHPERALRALFQHLGKHVPTAPDGFLKLSNLALVREGRAVLVPRGVMTWTDQIAPRINRAGWQFVDHPWSTVDLETSELIVPPPILSLTPGWETEIINNRSRREPAPVEPGRYRMTGWGAFSSEERAMSPAAGAAIVAGSVLNPREFGMRETIQRIIDWAGHIPITGLGSPSNGDFPARLMALDATSV